MFGDKPVKRTNYVFVEEKDGKKYYIDTIPKRFGVFKIAVLTEKGEYEIVKAEQANYLSKQYIEVIKKAKQTYKQEQAETRDAIKR
jgi:hypothetical protein